MCRFERVRAALDRGHLRLTGHGSLGSPLQTSLRLAHCTSHTEYLGAAHCFVRTTETCQVSPCLLPQSLHWSTQTAVQQ
jgi:hypothetical protein